MSISSQQLVQAYMALVTQHPDHEEAIADALLTFLVDHHLEGMLPAILRRIEFYQQQALAHDTVLITVSQDSPLSQALLLSLTQSLGISKDEHRHVTVDPALVGGCIVVHNGKRYDFSLERQLERLQSSLTTLS